MFAEKSFVCYFINDLYNALLVIICICVEAFITKVTLQRDLIDSTERTTVILKTCTINIYITFTCSSGGYTGDKSSFYRILSLQNCRPRCKQNYAKTVSTHTILCICLKYTYYCSMLLFQMTVALNDKVL